MLMKILLQPCISCALWYEYFVHILCLRVRAVFNLLVASPAHWHLTHVPLSFHSCVKEQILAIRKHHCQFFWGVSTHGRLLSDFGNIFCRKRSRIGVSRKIWFPIEVVFFRFLRVKVLQHQGPNYFEFFCLVRNALIQNRQTAWVDAPVARVNTPTAQTIQICPCVLPGAFSNYKK